MNFLGDLQLLSSLVKFTENKSLLGLDNEEEWRSYLLNNLMFTTADCSLLVHRLCAIIVDKASIGHYVQFIKNKTLEQDELLVVLHICKRCKSTDLLKFLISQAKQESDLDDILNLVKICEFTDLIPLIQKAKEISPIKSFEISLYYLKSNNDESVAIDTLKMGLFNAEILNLQVLSDLKIFGKSEFKDLLLHFMNGSKKGVQAWINENESFKEYSEIFNDKVELYALTRLCYKNMGQSISFQVISEECEIPVSRVEALIIQGFRKNLVSGRMNQDISFQVSKATPLVLSEQERLDLANKRMEEIREELTMLR